MEDYQCRHFLFWKGFCDLSHKECLNKRLLIKIILIAIVRRHVLKSLTKSVSVWMTNRVVKWYIL